MSDRRYSTSAWQRTRKAILRRDGYVCMIRGPRCLGAATTVHHIIPSSERPDLFWADDNLVSACSRCNYGQGAALKNRRQRQTVERLQQIIEAQQRRIDELIDRLMQYEQTPHTLPPPEKRRAPAIY